MRFYRLLLRLFPSSFRAEYAAALRALFALRQRQAAWRSAFWLREIADVALNALFVHLDVLRQDLRYASRTLWRSPAFTFTAVLVTALGVGANTAVFSVVDRVLLRPLPFAEPERLVTLWENLPGYSQMELSPPNFLDWQRLTTSFEAMGAYIKTSANLVAGSEAQRVDVALVTPELLPLLGVEPYLGRLLTKEDARETGSNVLLLSYGFWQQALGGSADVVGHSVKLNDAACTVVGVMPPELLFGVRSTHAAAYTVGLGLAVAATLAGSLIPALRAIRIDPTVALRAEA